jgi:hypothetical protein
MLGKRADTSIDVGNLIFIVHRCTIFSKDRGTYFICQIKNNFFTPAGGRHTCRPYKTDGVGLIGEYGYIWQIIVPITAIRGAMVRFIIAVIIVLGDNKS